MSDAEELFNVDINDLTVIDLPFIVLDGGSSAAVTINYTSTDTSL